MGIQIKYSRHALELRRPAHNRLVIVQILKRVQQAIMPLQDRRKPPRGTISGQVQEANQPGKFTVFPAAGIQILGNDRARLIIGTAIQVKA
ncbi:hypothetical protein KNO81_41210 [Paraburkholderia sediminicola]|nr:hypothetical protein [Paraburkholderia sediminicola]